MITKANFFESSVGRFRPCEKPSREPDYVSLNKEGEVSSSYWYNGKRLIRASNHWGRVAKCKWVILGINFKISRCIIYEESIIASISFKKLKLIRL